MLKICFLMLGRGELHIGILNGFSVVSEYLSPDLYQVDEFVSEDTSPGSINRMLRKVLSEKYDLFVVVAARCALDLKKMMNANGDLRPVVFVAVKDPVASGLIESEKRSGTNFAGVRMISPPDFLPIEVALKLFGLTRRYVVVYRDAESTGRGRYVARYLGEFIKKRLVDVEVVRVGEGDEPMMSLKDTLTKNDVVVVPEGGLRYYDVDLLKEICADVGADLFSGESSGVPEDAICGLSLIHI